MSSRFVAIPLSTYAGQPLPRAVPDANALAQALQEQHDYAVQVLADLSRGALLSAVDEHLGSGRSHGDNLIVAWTGHGEPDVDGGLLLLGQDGGRDVEVANARQLGKWAMRGGARQVLLLIDTCYAGRGLVGALGLAKAIVDDRRAEAPPWFGVVAACEPDDPARSGALAQQLLHLLRHGPRRQDNIYWHRSRPWIRGSELIHTLIEEWSEPRQMPETAQFGQAHELVRNPLFQSGLGERAVEDVSRAAAGAPGGLAATFTGREHELAEIVAWARQDSPGLAVLTGPPGCGKSALVQRLVGLSSPAQREHLLREGEVAADGDPGVGSIDALLRARGLAVDSAAEALAEQLGVDPRQGLHGVLGLARQRRLEGRPLWLVLDGLDEAGLHAPALAADLLRPLAQQARVLVATRDMPLADGSLIALLGSGALTVDLAEHEERTWSAVRRYVRGRLAGRDPAMDAGAIAEMLARPGGLASSAPFLQAQLITSQLLERPLDTGLPDWPERLARTAENALERDLCDTVLVLDGEPQPQAARELLRALAEAQGAGFPADDLWPAVASALSWSGRRYRAEHAYAALAALGRHIVVTLDGEQPVYRIAHRRLADYLLAQTQSDPARPAGLDPRRAIAAAVDEVYRQWLDGGGTPQGHRYLWRYAWHHLAEAGAPGLETLEALAARDAAAFDSDLVMAYQLVADAAMDAGQPQEALRCHTLAVARCRGLADTRRLVLALFHLAVLYSHNGDDERGDEAAEEATRLARSMSGDPAQRGALGLALLARAIAQLREGRASTARRLLGEVFEISPADDGESDEVLLCSAHALAAQACVQTQDLDAAQRHARSAVELGDRHDLATQLPGVYLEGCVALAVVELQLSVQTVSAPGPDAGAAPAEGGTRLLRELARPGRPRSAILDTVLAKGLAVYARQCLLEMQHAARDTEEVDAWLAAAADMVGTWAPANAEPSGVLAAVLFSQGQLRLAQGDAPAGLALFEQAIAAVRPWAAGNPMLAFDLGNYLNVQSALQHDPAEAASEAAQHAAIEQQFEAVRLLRPATSGPFLPVRANALNRLVLMLQNLVDPREPAVRDEAIRVLRLLAPTDPDARRMLWGQLIDRSAELAAQRTVESAQVAQEALALARSTGEHPMSDLMIGMSEVNVGGVGAMLSSLGLPGGIPAAEQVPMLEDAVRRLRPLQANPVMAAALGTAHMSLAGIALEGGDAARALEHARQSVADFDNPRIPPGSALNRLKARAVLGCAERAAGLAAQGTATLQAVIDVLRDPVRAQVADPASIALMIDRFSPDLWETCLDALARDPAMVADLRLARPRAAAGLDALVLELHDALGSAEGIRARAVREFGRMHRLRHGAAFDAAWRAAHGELPPWLSVAAPLLWSVLGWCNTDSWRESRDYLAAHPELLDPGTEVILDELALGGVAVELIEAHRALLGAARRDGVEAACAPLVLDEEVGAWLDSEDWETYLEQHPELLRPEVLRRLREADATDGSPERHALAAALELVQRGERPLAYEALRRPASLFEPLRVACGSSDLGRLRALATIGLVDDPDGPVQPLARLALALAQAVEQPEQPVAAATLEALAALEEARRDALRPLVMDTLARHPRAALPLANLLAALAGPAP